MSEPNFTNGISYNIRASIDKAIENNSKETFITLKEFVVRVMGLSVDNKSLNHFIEYILYPAFWYAQGYEKAKVDIRANRLYTICSEHAAVTLNSIIWFSIGFNNKAAKNIAGKRELNQFYYWAYYGFGQLLFYQLKNNDIKYFKYTINQINLISQPNDIPYEQGYQIKKLKESNRKGEHTVKINEMIDTKNVLEQPDTYKRHVLTSIRYWAYYLYSRNKLSINDTIEVTNIIRSQHHSSEDILADILFLNSRKYLGYLGIEGWDYTEREDGVAYSGPDPSHWTAFGFLIDQLRGNRIYINYDDLEIEQLNSIRYLLISLQNGCKTIENEFEKWKPILNIEDKETLKIKCKEVLKVFEESEKRTIHLREKEIETLPLNSQKIISFKELIGSTWYKNAKIRWLFKQHGNYKSIEISESSFRKVIRKVRSPKTMFIEGKYFNPGYGFERIGGEIGRSEDDFFLFDVAKAPNHKALEGSIVQILSNSISEFKEKNITPSLILVAPEYSYQDPELLEDKRFVRKMQGLPDVNFPGFFIGTFDEVPIYSSFSSFLNNKVLIADFANAFSMEFNVNDEWYNSELNVSVKLITDDEALLFYNSHPKWEDSNGRQLNQKEALTLIKNNVMVEVFSTINFIIKDTSRYIVGHLKGTKLE